MRNKSEMRDGRCETKTVAGLFLVVLLLITVAGCGGKPVKPPEMVSVTRGSMKAQTPTTGTVEPRNRLEIKPPVAGRIDTIYVAEGDNVRKGRILALMSSSDRAALLDAARSKSAAEYKQWEQAYKPAPIVAPLDGFIILKSIEPGQTVGASDAVLVMADKLIVKAQVDETDIGNITLGQPVTIQLDAYPDQTIKGKVEHIAYESQVINNVTIYEVDVTPMSVPSFFRSGMSATVNFIKEEKANILLLPQKAVKKVGAQTYVFQLDNASNKYKPMQIKTGLEGTDQIEVVSGLKEGDKVAVPDKNMLADLAAKNARGPRGPVNPFQRRN